jgi:hypothetical protein
VCNEKWTAGSAINKYKITLSMNKKIFMGILSTILALLGCGNAQVAKQITIDKLPEELIRLKDGKTEFDFFGITSNGTDCIYFIKDGGKFQIEFEAMIKPQVQYIDILKQFAIDNSFKITETTYGNQPQYESNETAPVLRINTNSDLTKTAEIGKIIEQTIFSNNNTTLYDVVP